MCYGILYAHAAMILSTYYKHMNVSSWKLNMFVEVTQRIESNIREKQWFEY